MRTVTNNSSGCSTPGWTFHRLASRARTFDFFERSGVWDVAPEHFRLHALATQRAADRLATEVSYSHRDRLMVTAMLHDIGKLVLLQAYPGYPEQVHGEAKTPEERIHRERRELGVDHALVGGVLARRWGLPKSIASTIERHHHEDGGDEAAFVRLADMLAHYAQGSPVSPSELLKVARQIGIGPAELRSVMYELPYPQTGRQRQIDPCPLSDREVEVLKRLASGKVYKQIASELSLSTSTVRTHLHNIYGKLGAVDRAQAVLAQYKSAVALPEIRPKNLMPMGQGRRKQMVTTIVDTNQEAHVGWLIQQVLKRQITPLEAFKKLLLAVRRRGARESLAMLASGVVRLIGKRT